MRAAGVRERVAAADQHPQPARRHPFEHLLGAREQIVAGGRVVGGVGRVTYSDPPAASRLISNGSGWPLEAP